MSDTESDGLSGLIEKLSLIFRNVTLYRQLLRCDGKDAQELLDLFQSAFGQVGLYPTCYELKDQIARSEQPLTAGGFADIYRGTFKDQVVCIKTIRVYESSDKENIIKQFSREVLLWGQLSHPNVLPIYGLFRLQDIPSLVMPWMENGNINQYLKGHPSGSRVSLVIEVARGLEYLHKNGIIHGDLKGANVLVGDDGRAYLADFGISSVSGSDILAWTSHSSVASRGGSIRWQAPELFDMENDEVVRNTESSDVYAWACVCYEIFTGRVPLYHISRDPTVMYQVKLGARSVRPEMDSPSWDIWGLNKPIWTTMNICWHENPVSRYTISQVLQFLNGDQVAERRDITYFPARFQVELQRNNTESERSAIRIIDQLISTETPLGGEFHNASEEHIPTFSEIDLVYNPTVRSIPTRTDLKVTAAIGADRTFDAIRIHPLLDVRRRPECSFDLASPSFELRIGAGVIDSLIEFAMSGPATVPALTRLCVVFEDDLPSDWIIDINAGQSSITVGSVFENVCKGFRRLVTSQEYGNLTPGRMEMVRMAFTRRCTIGGKWRWGYEAERARGVRRVDFLGSRTIFVGLLYVGRKDGFEIMKIVTSSLGNWIGNVNEF